MGTMLRDAPVPWGVPRLVAVADLRFDRRSPRLREVPETDSEDQVLERLWRESALEELAASIAANGFHADEPVIVEQHGHGLVVLDGNRRLAAVRMLTDRTARERLNAGDLPAADTDELVQLPALLSSRDAVWQSVGYRHVAGMQPWRSYARAGYVAWAHEELGVPLDGVARSVGDTGAGVRLLYQALRVLRTAESSGVFGVEDRWASHLPFSLLVDALDLPGIRAFLGLADDPQSQVRLAELGELCAWLFGRRSRDRAPVVTAHEPDLARLAQTVTSPAGLAALREGVPLALAHAAGRDSRVRFREKLREAAHLLQEARGALSGDADVEPDLVRSVDDLVLLAHSIRADLRSEGAGPRGLLTDP
jgi:hypothetical protein